MARHQEIEIKLHVPDLEVVRQRLEAVGAVLTKPRVYERNVRYDDAERSHSLAYEVVRLRQDDVVRLTFKSQDAGDKKLNIRTEIEVEVSDFDDMHLILEKFGLRPFMTYEKYRTTYVLDEQEVVLDELPFGFFVEIEGDKKGIASVREKLNLQDAYHEKASYNGLFERVCRNMGLSFRDLTFENFKDIDVPDSAFVD